MALSGRLTGALEYWVLLSSFVDTDYSIEVMVSAEYVVKKSLWRLPLVQTVQFPTRSKMSLPHESPWEQPMTVNCLPRKKPVI